MVTEELVELMICPACGARVQLKPDGTGIKCTACRRVYPIKDDIPAMLVEQATIEEEGLREEGGGRS
ncbi:MAG TPA: Trm112 family protein [Pyrinomonadaceae bacterium]|jgi:hypothetical protein